MTALLTGIAGKHNLLYLLIWRILGEKVASTVYSRLVKFTPLTCQMLVLKRPKIVMNSSSGVGEIGWDTGRGVNWYG